MIRNTDISKKEEGNVGTEAGNVTNVHQSDKIEDRDDVSRLRGTFLRKEPIVLISLVCLSLLNAMTIAVQMRGVHELQPWLRSIIMSAVPVAGLIFAAFLSEVTGRKPVYIYLFALSILSCILQISSTEATIVSLTWFLQGVGKGGALVLNALAISEYSSSKHRFSWMLAHVATWHTVTITSNFISWDTEVVPNVLIGIQIVLGLMCLGSTWVWPESPYWLASKGKLEESRKAFLFLRGEESREELSSVLKARRRPGPPKLFWTGLALAIATMSVTMFSDLQMMHTFRFYHKDDNYELWVLLVGSIVVFSVIAVMSYFIKRRLLIIVVCGISFVLSYAITVWMYLELENYFNGIFPYIVFLVFDVITKCGLTAFGGIMYIEIVPYKYNTVISCICFIVLYLSNIFLISLHFKLESDFSFHPALLSAFYATLALIGVLLYYFFAPETKDKTLLEIQRSYTPNENDSNPEQNLSMIQNNVMG